MAVVEATRTREIAASSDRIWELVTDLGAASTWAPVVPSSEWVGPRSTEVGAQRRCTFDPPAGRKWVREVVTEVDPSTMTQVLEVVDGPARPPFDKVEGITTVAPAGPDRSTVTITLRVTTRGAFQRAMALAGRPMLAKTVRRLLAGMDHHLTTGQQVADVKALKAERVRI